VLPLLVPMVLKHRKRLRSKHLVIAQVEDPF
jgi:hypothetical protein